MVWNTHLPKVVEKLHNSAVSVSCVNALNTNQVFFNLGSGAKKNNIE